MTEAVPMNQSLIDRLQSKKGKDLYGYQAEAIETIMGRMRKFPNDYNLLYQLPTGGGKTVIFSELAKRYFKRCGACSGVSIGKPLDD